MKITFERGLEVLKAMGYELEQAEQEPVEKFLENNLVVENERAEKSGHRVLEIREEELLRIIELYTAPQPVKEVELTDDDVAKAYMECTGGDIIARCRAVIAAHKEKNK